jgi:ABC-type Fe3+-hydroxamate transport system substrate-binding protein
MPVLQYSPLLILGVAAIAACTRSEHRPVATVTDDFGDSIAIGEPPARVVSLNPATTEIVFAIGSGSRLVGRTHWDLYPAAAARVPDLGTGIRPNVEAVLGAHPDLVLLYASADNRAAAKRLRAAGVKTLSLKIDRIGEFLRATRTIGRILGDSAKGVLVADSVRATLDHVREVTRTLQRPTVFWHIWDAPLITIGGGSYMTQLVAIAGGTNVYGEMSDVSPTVSLEDVIRRNPRFVITGPEGAAKIKADPKWRVMPAVREGRVLVVDTALVGRPAVRLGEAALQIAILLHPEKERELKEKEREGGKEER